MKLPFLVSVPHAGLHVPREIQDICLLTPEEIYDDSDGGAAEIYFELEKYVEAFISSNVARAIVDLNRTVAIVDQGSILLGVKSCLGN